MKIFIGVVVVLFQLFASDIALDYLNWMRVQAGLTPLKRNHFLTDAAASHANYLVKNQSSGHKEKANDNEFFAATPFDRAAKAGFGSRYVLENISYGDKDAFDSIDTLFASIYHRLVFLHPFYDTVGIAFKKSDRYKFANLSVYLLGNHELANLCNSVEKPSSGVVYTNFCSNKKPVAKSEVDRIFYETAQKAPPLILWPYPGARHVLPVFYEEIPDPLPQCSVSGYPVSVTFNPAKMRDVVVERFELFENEKRVPSKLLTASNDPNKKLRSFEYVLMPLQRLRYHTNYRVQLVFHDAKGEHKVTWNFWTKDAPFRVVKLQPKVKIHAKKYYTLYKEPQNCNDVVTGLWLRCSRGVRCAYKRNDRNSYNFYFDAKRDGWCRLRMGKKDYRLRIIAAQK